jgi:NADH-quinone oxidoreductase subunit E
MSARQLAEIQPDSFAFAPDSAKDVEFWLAKYPENRKQSAVIPLLWIAQKQDGWVTRPAMERIAEQLGMPYIRVLEVATFYTMFNLAPVGEHLIQLCGTTPCMLRGSEALKEVLYRRIGPKGAISADGKFTWMEVECLGACCNAPMAQISNTAGDHFYEDLTPQILDQLLDAFARGETPRPGPQIARQTSAPEGDPITLTDPSLFDGSRARKVDLPNRPRREGQAGGQIAGAGAAGAADTPGKPLTTSDNQAMARTNTQQTPQPVTKTDVEAPKTSEGDGAGEAKKDA